MATIERPEHIKEKIWKQHQQWMQVMRGSQPPVSTQVNQSPKPGNRA